MKTVYHGLLLLLLVPSFVGVDVGFFLGTLLAAAAVDFLTTLRALDEDIFAAAANEAVRLVMVLQECRLSNVFPRC